MSAQLQEMQQKAQNLKKKLKQVDNLKAKLNSRQTEETEKLPKMQFVQEPEVLEIDIMDI